MFLPDSILECLDALENAGYAAYAVGGCVRDACLGLTPHDYDLCTSALPRETEAVFGNKRLVLAGEKHGTVGVVTDFGVVEITTFRTEEPTGTTATRTGWNLFPMWNAIWPAGISR